MMARAALNNLANATAGRSAQIPHAARPSLGARCNRYRAALRLGWRDALRHKARTLLSLLLVMLPIAAMVASIGMTTTIPPTRSRALATIPADTQAVITATAVPTPANRSGSHPKAAAGGRTIPPSSRPRPPSLRRFCRNRIGCSRIGSRPNSSPPPAPRCNPANRPRLGLT